MLIERLMKVALLGSEWVLYLLALLSMLSFSVMAERWLYFRRHRGDAEQLRREVSEALGRNDLPAAAEATRNSRLLEAKIVHEALRWAHAGPDAVGDAVEAELSSRRKELEVGTTFLGTVGNNAPFIGLFGTVLGVIIAFQALGQTGSNSGAMGEVMAGIAEALVATGVGLFVALPAVVAYNVVQKRILEIETEATALTKLVTAFVRARTERFEPLAAHESSARANTQAPLNSERNATSERGTASSLTT